MVRYTRSPLLKATLFTYSYEKIHFKCDETDKLRGKCFLSTFIFIYCLVHLYLLLSAH